MQAANAQRIDRLVDHLRDTPIRDARIVQLTTGNQTTSSLHVVDPDILLIRTVAEPRISSEILPDPDWIALTVPLRWKGDYVYNGMIAEPDDLFLWSDGDAYHTVGAGRDVIGIGLRRSRLIREFGALLGHVSVYNIPSNIRIRPGSRVSKAIRLKLVAAMRVGLDAPRADGSFRMPTSVANALISDLASCLIAQSASSLERDLG